MLELAGTISANAAPMTNPCGRPVPGASAVWQPYLSRSGPLREFSHLSSRRSSRPPPRPFLRQASRPSSRPSSRQSSCLTCACSRARPCDDLLVDTRRPVFVAKNGTRAEGHVIRKLSSDYYRVASHSFALLVTSPTRHLMVW